MKYYDSNDDVPDYLIKVYQNDFILLSSLHVPIEDYDNIMDENNQREGIEFEISVSLKTMITLITTMVNFGGSI